MGGKRRKKNPPTSPVSRESSKTLDQSQNLQELPAICPIVDIDIQFLSPVSLDSEDSSDSISTSVVNNAENQSDDAREITEQLNLQQSSISLPGGLVTKLEAWLQNTRKMT